MQRRRFTQALAAAGMTGLLPGATLPSAFAQPQEDAWRAQFNDALQQKPWLLGYQGTSQDQFNADAKISGKWPTELRGTLYRNGPAQHEVSGYRYRHWFDGDGMLQVFSMGDRGVRHQGRWIETEKFKAERAAGRALYPGFGSVPPNPAPVTSADAVNSGNISILHHHEKLFALWEAGSPWEIDTDSLETQGAYAFSEHTAGVPFSAHPRVEADGTLWNFGYVSGANLLVLWHIDARGKVVKMGKVRVDPITMVHDFIVTSRHIVALVPPLHYEPTGNTAFLQRHQWHEDAPTQVLVIDKNDFDNHFTLELPAQWVFHFGNGWEDNDGIIRFDAARAENPAVMTSTFVDIMRGVETPSASSHHHSYRIDTRKRTVSEAPIFGMNIDSEFPTIDPRISCRRNELLVMLTGNTLAEPTQSQLNEVSLFSYSTGKRSAYRYPNSQMPEEHIYVGDPHKDPETDGWVVGTALDWERRQTLINVFDARSVADGPIATAKLPYALPLGLHGKFVHA